MKGEDVELKCLVYISSPNVSANFAWPTGSSPNACLEPSTSCNGNVLKISNVNITETYFCLVTFTDNFGSTLMTLIKGSTVSVISESCPFTI